MKKKKDIILAVRNAAFELRIMNQSLLLHKGDLSEKSLNNFKSEINRLSGILLNLT